MLLMVINGYWGSMELFFVLLHIYVIALATMHQSRSKDRYQNRAMWLCIAGFWVYDAMMLLGWADKDNSSQWFTLLWMALPLSLLASAMAHEGMGWKNHGKEVESKLALTSASGQVTGEGSKGVK